MKKALALYLLTASAALAGLDILAPETDGSGSMGLNGHRIGAMYSVTNDGRNVTENGTNILAEALTIPALSNCATAGGFDDGQLVYWGTPGDDTWGAIQAGAGADAVILAGSHADATTYTFPYVSPSLSLTVASTADLLSYLTQAAADLRYVPLSTNWTLALPSAYWGDAQINSGPTSSNAVWPQAIATGIDSHWTGWTTGAATQQSQWVYADVALPVRGVSQVAFQWIVSNVVDTIPITVTNWNGGAAWTTTLTASAAGVLQAATATVSTAYAWTNPAPAIRLQAGILVSTNPAGLYGWTAQPLVLVRSL